MITISVVRDPFKVSTSRELWSVEPRIGGKIADYAPAKVSDAGLAAFSVIHNGLRI